VGTHFQKFFDKEFLGSYDLPEGKEVTVTIENVVGGELQMPGKKKKAKKPVISFVGKEKKFVCNVTNAKTIAKMYGNEVEKWKGKQITLYVSVTRNPEDGKDIDCLRIRPSVPADKTPTTLPSGGEI
jgi:hypothetical protein